MKTISILGAGMAGFGAASKLREEKAEFVVFEKNPFPGGQTSSLRYEEGFIFDNGPHISFTKIPRIQELFARSVNHEYEVIQPQVNNYWKGHWIKHPAQCNLYGLPEDLVINILRDFLNVMSNSDMTIENYEDWLIASYGETFARTFPMEYGLKFHTTDAANMTTDWIGPRMYRPKLEEVLQGVLSPRTPDVHYVDHFRYPRQNGFVSYLNLFLREAEIRTDHAVIAIDPVEKKLTFSNGMVTEYGHLISSVPLPELVPMIDGAPREVLDASRKLACTTCVIVNIGIRRSDIAGAHWSYFYDQDMFFTRLSFPHMQSSRNVPEGCGSIQAEVYFSRKYKPLDRTPQQCAVRAVARG
jgi:protoporphyrinogen oxidase